MLRKEARSALAAEDEAQTRITGTSMLYGGYRCSMIFKRGTREHVGWEMACKHGPHQLDSGCRKTCNFKTLRGDRTEDQVLESLRIWADAAGNYTSNRDHNRQGWLDVMATHAVGSSSSSARAAGEHASEPSRPAQKKPRQGPR